MSAVPGNAKNPIRTASSESLVEFGPPSSGLASLPRISSKCWPLAGRRLSPEAFSDCLSISRPIAEPIAAPRQPFSGFEGADVAWSYGRRFLCVSADGFAGDSPPNYRSVAVLFCA